MNNLYIPSIDAKDLYIAEANGGYKLNGLRRYINSFDYSLDLIELRKISRSAYYGTGDRLSFKKDGKEYSSKIINVTFKYSVKEFNHFYSNLYVRYGYDIEGKEFINNCIVEAGEGGELTLIAAYVDTPCPAAPPSELLLPSYFSVEYDDIKKCYYFRIKSSVPTIYGRARLRHMLYEDGFTCDGIKYCRFKRSSGSARVGKCLFIDERLYPIMHESEKCGLSYERGDSLDLAALEAYISLTSSSIIDTIPIEPKNILLIDDYESVFTEEAVCTDVDPENHLVTTQKLMTIKNSIWDGQSLIDPSLMGPYADKGCILLRNKFFKSCCFNTNIQLYFEDFGIADISQLNGITVAEDIKDIKLITTPSSIKYLKFGPYEQWLKHIYPEFGIVKYDKNTHFFEGRLVQGHYQLINTLQLSEAEVKELIKPELEYLSSLNTDLDMMRFHLKMCSDEDLEPDNVMPTKNDIVYNLLQYDVGFERTKMFRDFRHDLCRAYQKNMKKGHILLNGTYATLFGNPYEMLKQAVGKFDGESSMKVGTVHNIRFPYGADLLGCRSPSVAIGNLLLTKNAEHLEIDRYFNLTNNIVCINSINENILERLSGADFDSDTMLITDNKILIEALKRNYKYFKVPTRNVNPPKKNRVYCAKDLADLDIKTGTNKIGEIINFSQELNSLLWDKVYRIGKPVGECFHEIEDIYYDACQLDVMSNIEIDSAKKEFSVSNITELQLLRDKYADEFTRYTKKIKPKFLGFIAQTKGYYDPKHKDYLHHHTAMDYLLTNINRFKSESSQRVKEESKLSDIFKPQNYKNGDVNWKQIHVILDMVKDVNGQIRNVYANRTYSKGEKEQIVLLLKKSLSTEINNIKINEATMYKLFTMVEDSIFSNLLLIILFSYKNYSLIETIRCFEPNHVDIIGYEGGNIDIMGGKYIKIEV